MKTFLYVAVAVVAFLATLYAVMAHSLHMREHGAIKNKKILSFLSTMEGLMLKGKLPSRHNHSAT